MNDASPQQFFRFAADHADLLQALFRESGGVTEAQVYGHIRKYAVPGDPSAAHVFTRLQELGILESAPDATACYELSRPFAGLMRFLLRQYRLTSVTVIQAYFAALNEQAGQIARAQAENNPEQWMRVVLELVDHLEAMRHDSRSNRNGVIARVMQIKTARDRIPAPVRYQEVNRLWQTYIIPLRDMIDSRKVLDSSLKQTREVLSEAGTILGVGRPEIQRRAEDVLARLVRLRQDVLADFEESLREITPLYEELRRENAVSRGASAAIELFMKGQLGVKTLARRLGVPNWQIQGQFSDSMLEGYIARLQDYTPAPPPPLQAGDAAGGEPFDLEDFDRLVLEALPIGDGLGWLTEQYAGQSLAVVLRLYGRLHAERYGPASFAARPAIYRHRDRQLRAYPMRINSRPPKEQKHVVT